MAFDLAVTISMHFYERCQTNRDVWNFEKKGDSSTLVRLSPRCVCGGGGYSDIFIHTLARAFFRVQNFEFQYFWGFQKTEYLLVWRFCGYFLDHHKIGLSRYRLEDIFWVVGLLKFQIFIGVLQMPEFFFWRGGGGNGRCWARAYIWRKMRAPPPPGVCPSVQTYPC